MTDITLTDILAAGGAKRLDAAGISAAGGATTLNVYSLADVGLWDGASPFVLLLLGQSNAPGLDTGGDKTNPSNTFIIDNFTSPTALVPAVFGTAPLNAANGGGTTSNPALARNNMAVHFANAMRASGVIPADRPIVILAAVQGSQPISQWVPTTQPLWVDLLSQLAILEAEYPGAEIDHVIWAQGEADNSSTTYPTDFATLISQLRALDQWREDTTFSAQELGTWAGNTTQNQNAFFRKLRHGLYDRYIDMVTSTGCVESAEQPGPHFDGASLVTLGKRHFAAWLQARISGGYHGSPTYWGSDLSIPNAMASSTGNTLVIGPDDARSGVIALTAAGGTVNLPRSTVCEGLQVLVSVTAQTTFVDTLGVGFLQENSPVTSTTSLALNPGNYRLTVLRGRWYVETVRPRTGGMVWSSASIAQGASHGWSAEGTRFSFYLYDGVTATMGSVNLGACVGVYGKPGGSASTLNGSIVLANGQAVSSVTLLPGQRMLFLGINSTWVVIYDSFSSTPTTVSNLPSAATVGAGLKGFVTDATATTFGSVVAGGGSNKVPVYSDGADWRIG